MFSSFYSSRDLFFCDCGGGDSSQDMQLLADIPSDGFGMMKDKRGEHQTQQGRQGSLARLT